MKNLKFRAWDGRKMWYDGDIFPHNRNSKRQYPCRITNFGIHYVIPYDESKKNECQCDYLKTECFADFDIEKFKIEGVEIMQFAELVDSKGTPIFDGDILSDWTETDEGLFQSFYPVFWNQQLGQWSIDMSLEKDRTTTGHLAHELSKFEYEIMGN